MSLRPTPEQILISALINSGEPLAAERHHITPNMIPGYESEYRWLLSYAQTYGKAPSMSVFQTKFPEFVVSDETDVGFACDEVREEHTRRELVRTIKGSAQHLASGDIEAALFEVTSFAPPIAPQVSLSNILTDDSFLADWDKPVECVGVPWSTLSAVTGGLRRGDLWYIAARLGQGKSWTLGSMARKALMDGHRVLLFSLEMGERQVQTRMHALMAQALGKPVTHTALRDRVFDRGMYRELMGEIREQVPGTLHVYDASRGPCSPGTVKSMAGDYDLVLIDYVGLMSSPLGHRAVDDWRTMAAISNMLKESAVATGTPIVGAAQINRDGDSTNWRPPKVKNLAQSDALGQDGDVVLTHKQYGPTAMVYSIEKNRHGQSGVLFFTTFDPEHGRLDEISKPAADDLRDESID